MAQRTSIRATTFDFWGTLFRDANQAARKEIRIEAFAKATGLPRDLVDEAMAATWVEFDRCHREEHRTLTAADAVRLTAERLGVQVAPSVADSLAEVFATAALKESPEPIEGALDAVQAAARHTRVGVISDSGVSPGRALRELLRRHGFLEHLLAAVFSDEVGVAKPEPLIFHVALGKLGVQPPELLHIGDLEYSDIMGANAVGAQSALFAGENRCYRDTTRANHVFDTWEEFIELLPELVDPPRSSQQNQPLLDRGLR